MNTITKNTTHISAVRAQQISQMQAVCEALRWTEEQYCLHQFEEYELFASAIAKDYPERRQQIRYSPVFRGFFNNEWAARNDEFLFFAYDVKYDIDLAEQEYLYTHNYLTLINDDAFFERFNSLLKLI